MGYRIVWILQFGRWWGHNELFYFCCLDYYRVDISQYHMEFEELMKSSCDKM